MGLGISHTRRTYSRDTIAGGLYIRFGPYTDCFLVLAGERQDHIFRLFVVFRFSGVSMCLYRPRPPLRAMPLHTTVFTLFFQKSDSQDWMVSKFESVHVHVCFTLVFAFHQNFCCAYPYASENLKRSEKVAMIFCSCACVENSGRALP
jgi:hypothetical protein